MNSLQIIITITVIALATMFTRFLPFLVFNNTDKLPKFVRYLAEVLPFAVIGILVVYSLRNIKLFNDNTLFPTLISLSVIVLLHLWKRQVLLSILLGTLCYMFLLQVVF